MDIQKISNNNKRCENMRVLKIINTRSDDCEIQNFLFLQYSEMEVKVENSVLADFQIHRVEPARQMYIAWSST